MCGYGHYKSTLVCVYIVGVAPGRGNQWTDEVKSHFSRQVVEKTFVVFIQPQMNVLSASSASLEHWPVVLVESLENRTFIFVHATLANKCRDVQPVTLK